MKTWRILVALIAIAALAAGCSRSGGGRQENEHSTTATSADFGTLPNLCRAGTLSGATGRGVSADSITLGVFTDMGFTKNSELVDAANVFTSWCNDHVGNTQRAGRASFARPARPM